MRLIFDTEPILVEINPKMSVLQSAASVMENLSSEHASEEPTINMAINGHDEIDISEKNPEIKADGTANLKNVAEMCELKKYNEITERSENETETEDYPKTNDESKIGDDSKEDNELQAESESKTGNKECVNDKVVMEEQDTMDGEVSTNDKTDKVTNSDKSEDGNEEDEEPMEHLELSENDDENDGIENGKTSPLVCNKSDVLNSQLKSKEVNTAPSKMLIIDSIPEITDTDLQETNDKVILSSSVESHETNGDSTESEITTNNILEDEATEKSKDVNNSIEEDTVTEAIPIVNNETVLSDDTINKDLTSEIIKSSVDEDIMKVKVESDVLASNPRNQIEEVLGTNDTPMQSLEDFINSTDVKEDPTLNDVELNIINEKENEIETSEQNHIVSAMDTDSVPANVDSMELDTMKSSINEDGPVGNIQETTTNRKKATHSLTTIVNNTEDKDIFDTSLKPPLESSPSDNEYEEGKQTSVSGTSVNEQITVAVDEIVSNKVNGNEEKSDYQNITRNEVNQQGDAYEQVKHILGDDKSAKIASEEITASGESAEKSVEANTDETADNIKADKVFNSLLSGNESTNETIVAGQVTMDKTTDEKTASGKTTDPAVNYSEESRDCVMLDDDEDNDDIMVIDEDVSTKTDGCINKSTKEVSEEVKKSVEAEKPTLIEEIQSSGTDDDVVISTDVSNKVSPTKEDIKDEDIQEKNIVKADADKVMDEKPLVALDFLKSFKPKMTDMTRGDLEEFCILKILEGVVDRSNLSDIKAKLKTMMQNAEEWRKKAMVLNKQNRDLQIVLRTVQEEQKKRSDEIITPLKITRSVGMQVLMTENKSDPSFNRGRGQKRTAANTANATTPKTTPVKVAAPNKNTKTPIPVPRLVPALNSSPSKPGTPRSSPQLQNSTVTSNSTGKVNATPNGVRAVPQTKPAEKRPYSVSIDLTDDEPPPAKQMATGKGMQPPVRLVPSQQLMAPGHRSPLLQPKQSSSNPRQVYIPIGGPQGSIRPGQTIVFKTNQQNIRSRHPGPGSVVRGQANSMARAPGPRAALNKHPAPLPQAYQQQPHKPSWKALPPAPDLKISKIENGIVVSWKIDGYQEDSYEEIVSYQLYAYQETKAPASTFLWNKIGDIKALPLPMACTLTQFIAGYKYYFAVRAVDAQSRIGPFSLPGSILLLNK